MPAGHHPGLVTELAASVHSSSELSRAVSPLLNPAHGFHFRARCPRDLIPPLPAVCPQLLLPPLLQPRGRLLTPQSRKAPSCPRAFASAVPAACHADLYPHSRCLHLPFHVPTLSVSSWIVQAAPPARQCRPASAKVPSLDFPGSLWETWKPGKEHLARSLQSLTQSWPSEQSSRSTGQAHGNGWEVAPQRTADRLGRRHQPPARKQHFPRGGHRAERQ